MKVLTGLLAIVLLASPGLARHMDRAESRADFDKLKLLVGEWEGKAFEDGKEVPTDTDFRIVSGGSVLMNRLRGDTPDEMITMFHMDGNDLLATHYCSAKNQPRMRAVPGSDPKVVAFVFKDATDVNPKQGRMDQVKFTLVDDNHHVQEWTFLDKGQLHTGRFEFTRKK
jgi:hypothetical protein